MYDSRGLESTDFESLYRAALDGGKEGGKLYEAFVADAQDGKGGGFGFAILADLYVMGGNADPGFVNVVVSRCRSLLLEEEDCNDSQRAHFLSCTLPRAMEVGVRGCVAKCVSMWDVSGSSLPISFAAYIAKSPASFDSVVAAACDELASSSGSGSRPASAMKVS